MVHFGPHKKKKKKTPPTPATASLTKTPTSAENSTHGTSATSWILAAECFERWTMNQPIPRRERSTEGKSDKKWAHPEPDGYNMHSPLCPFPLWGNQLCTNSAYHYGYAYVPLKVVLVLKRLGEHQAYTMQISKAGGKRLPV